MQICKKNFYDRLTAYKYCAIDCYLSSYICAFLWGMKYVEQVVWLCVNSLNLNKDAYFSDGNECLWEAFCTYM